MIKNYVVIIVRKLCSHNHNKLCCHNQKIMIFKSYIDNIVNFRKWSLNKLKNIKLKNYRLKNEKLKIKNLRLKSKKKSADSLILRIFI